MSAPFNKKEEAKKAKPNPNAPILAFVVAAIKGTDDPTRICYLAQTAEVAYRMDWGSPAEDTPEEYAYYEERELVLGALVKKLEWLFSRDALYREKRIGYLEHVLQSMPRSGFTVSDPGNGIPARMEAVRERILAQIGRLTLDARMKVEN